MTTADDTEVWGGPEPARFPAPVQDVPKRDSPLGNLKARREKQQAALFRDLLVPGWHEDPDDPNPISIYVRCKPSAPSTSGRAMERRKALRAKNPNWLELANADVLIDACVGVYAIQGAPAEDPATDERHKISLREGDPDGDHTKFDQDLGEALGLVMPFVAADVVLALYPTEAQLVTAVNELVRWSGLVAPKDDEGFFSS